MEEYKYLAVTKQEAELIMDSFRVSNPATRNLALKVAGVVLEFAAEQDVKKAQKIMMDVHEDHGGGAVKLTARQRKRRAYSESLPPRPYVPRPPRPAKPVRVTSATPKPARRNTMPPIFYFAFGGFGCAYAVYYLVLLISNAVGHHVDQHGKPIAAPEPWYYLIAVLFLLLSLGNLYIGLRVRRERRANR